LVVSLGIIAIVVATVWTMSRLTESGGEQGGGYFADVAIRLLVSADQGNADAQYRLGLLFQDGSGVPRDHVQALKWFSLAAAQGLVEARAARDELSRKLSREQLAEALRLTSEWSLSHSRATAPRPDPQTAIQPGTGLDLADLVRKGEATALSSQLASGLNPNSLNSQGETLLNLAIRENNLATVEVLLRAGADPNLADGTGRTPLELAAATGNDAIVRALVTQGAKVAGDSKAKPLESAAGGNQANRPLPRNTPIPAQPSPFPFDTASQQELARELLGSTASGEPSRNDPRMAPSPGTGMLDPVPRADSGMPRPLFKTAPEDSKAARSATGSPSLYGAVGGPVDDPAARRRVGFEKLTIAAGNGDVTAVRSLIGEGIPVNDPSHEDKTPLIAAAEGGHTPVIGLLLTAGANVNARDRSGTTALMAAARAGDRDGVSLLLDRDADVSAHNSAGLTAVDLARQKGHTEIVRLLTQRAEETRMRHNRIVTAQSLLTKLGYDAGAADGVAGPRTQSAIIRFQKDKGMKADGMVSDVLIKRLEAEIREREARRLAEANARRKTDEGMLPGKMAPSKSAEGTSLFDNLVGGFRKFLGLDFDSIRRPVEFRDYCVKNQDTWIYDQGKEKFVFCRDVVSGGRQ
jgi:ankyrin repeat protein